MNTFCLEIGSNSMGPTTHGTFQLFLYDENTPSPIWVQTTPLLFHMTLEDRNDPAPARIYWLAHIEYRNRP